MPVGPLVPVGRRFGRRRGDGPAWWVRHGRGRAPRSGPANLRLAAIVGLVLGGLAAPVGQAQDNLTLEMEDRAAAATVLVAALVVAVEDGVPTAEHHIRPLGSGTMVSPDGLILTNRHVVSGEPGTPLARLRADLDAEMGVDGNGVELRVESVFLVYVVDRIGDFLSREFTATVDPSPSTRDLAVLRITGDARGFPLRQAVSRPYLDLGNSSAVRLRDPVYIFGYPEFGDTSSTAIESITTDAIDGSVRQTVPGPGIGNLDEIRVDATISFRSSGGPVLGADGRLIGITTLAAAGAGGGSAAAVTPVNLAKPLLAKVDPARFGSGATSASSTPTETPDPSPTATGSPTPSPSPTAPAELTATPSPTATLSPTATPPPTETPLPTDTPAPPTDTPRPTPEPTAGTVNVEVIVDASGSMAREIEGERTRIEVTKRVLNDLIDAIVEREGINVGLRVYGHKGSNTEADREESCQSSDLLVPIKGVDKAALRAAVDGLQPVGWTPLALALERAGDDFPSSDGDTTNAVILVTDGEETCGGDPAAVAGRLRRGERRLTTHVVSLGLTEDQQRSLRSIAAQGGGDLVAADTAAELSQAIGGLLARLGVVPGAESPPTADETAAPQATRTTASPAAVRETVPPGQATQTTTIDVGFPWQIDFGGVRFSMDRTVPLDPRDFTRVSEFDGLEIYAPSDQAPFDRLYAAEPGAASGARYLPELPPGPDGAPSAEAPCPAEVMSFDVVAVGEAEYTYAGAEPDLTTDLLDQVAQTGDGQPIYAEGTEQPFAELYFGVDDSLHRFVLLDEQGIPKNLAGTIAFGGQVFALDGDATGEVDPESLDRAGCAGPYPLRMAPGESGEEPVQVYLILNALTPRVLSFTAREEAAKTAPDDAARASTRFTSDPRTDQAAPFDSHFDNAVAAVTGQEGWDRTQPDLGADVVRYAAWRP